VRRREQLIAARGGPYRLGGLITRRDVDLLLREDRDAAEQRDLAYRRRGLIQHGRYHARELDARDRAGAAERPGMGAIVHARNDTLRHGRVWTFRLTGAHAEDDGEEQGGQGALRMRTSDE